MDFIKAQLINAKEVLEQNDLLDFIGKHSIKTGEVNEKMKIAEYNGLKFFIYKNGYVLMQGSLHKYMNKGEHNYNKFSFIDLQNVLSDISEKFNLQLDDCILKNIEFGVNITPPIKTDTILNNLLYHKTKRFKDVAILNGNYKQAEHAQYLVKIYNKGLHYCLCYELMRFELKFIKMKKINDFAVYTLNDLLNMGWIKPIEQLLITEWRKTMLFEQAINKRALNAILREKKTNQWASPNYWLDLTKQQRNRQIEAYSNYVAEYTENNKLKIENLMLEKWNDLQSQCLPSYTSIIG